MASWFKPYAREPWGRSRGDAGTVALELVLLVPVLVLVTLFVVWAGRGGQVALSTDLAAEEAATAAAYCCEDDDAGSGDREAITRDMLRANPHLGVLCIGGPQPGAPPDPAPGALVGAPGDPLQFVREEWVGFEPGRFTGGAGVLGVQFTCETDGAVAPLRGLFPTVTFRGQASEVVLRQSLQLLGFKSTRFTAREDSGHLDFTVSSVPAYLRDVTVTYQVVTSATPPTTTAETDDFSDVTDFMLLSRNTDLTGTLVIPANQDEAMISVTLEDDGFYDSADDLVLEIISAVDSTGVSLPIALGRRVATGTIIDDDPQPYLQILPPTPTVDEGGDPNDAGDGDLVFKVRLGTADGNKEAPNESDVTVMVMTVDDPAAAALDCATARLSPTVPCEWATPDTKPAGDYTPVPGLQLMFPKGVQLVGDLTLDVPVKTFDDKASPVGETDEVVLLRLDGEAGATVRDGYRVRGGIILDDEARVAVADAASAEGDDPGKHNTVDFEIQLDRAADADVKLTVKLEPDGNSTAHAATAGTDCTNRAVDYLLWDDPNMASNFTDELAVTINKGDQRGDVPPVRLCGDRLVEHDETFLLEITVDSGAAVAPAGGGARGTISNDDNPVVSIVADPPDATGSEGQADPLRFTVGITVGGQPAQLTKDVTVDYAINSAGANPATAPGLAGADYSMSLGSAVPPALSGATLSGTLTFTSAVTEHVFEATLLSDYLPENDETFFVDLDMVHDPVGATEFADPDGNPNTDDAYVEATIEEVAPPSLSVSDFSGAEGTTAEFTVTLSGHRNEEVKVDYVIAGTGPPDGATDPGAGVTAHDYTAPALSGTLTFAAGTTSQDVPVRLRRDHRTENPEKLRLTLDSPQQAVLADRDPGTSGVQAYGEGTIVNAAGPALVVSDADAREGEQLSFTIALCRPIDGEDVTVAYRTDARSAVAGEDFDPIPAVPSASSPTLDFPAAMAAGEAADLCGDGVDAKTRTVTVTTLTDSDGESDEEVHLVLRNQMPSELTLGDPVGVGRIVNVSPATVRVTNPTAVEGGPLTFVISLRDETSGVVGDRAPDATIDMPVRVYYATPQRTGRDAAAAGADYTPVPADPMPCLTVSPPAGCPFVEFDPASPVRQIPVAVTTLTDTLDEDDETVTLELRLPQSILHAVRGDAEGTGIIEDDDPPALRIEDAEAQEGHELKFDVVLGVRENGRFVERATSKVVTFFAATEDGTAVAGDDYTAVSPRRQLTIPAGQKRISVPLSIATVLDDVPEAPETMRVELSAARNARIDKATAIGTINPACVNISFDDPVNGQPTFVAHDGSTVPEGGQIAPLVSVSRPLCSEFHVTYQLMEGTGPSPARCGEDLACTRTNDRQLPARNSLSHYRGTLGNIGQVGRDSLDEDDETFLIAVEWGPSMPSHYQGQTPVIVEVTIVDDDPEPALRISDASADEGDPMAFTLSLDAPSGRTVTVEYRTVPSSGTATGSTDPGAVDADYTAVGWTRVAFAPGPSGETSHVIQVDTVNDGPDGADETFLVEVRAPVPSIQFGAAPPLNAVIVQATAVGTILEGSLPELRIRDASADEGASMEFEVVLSEPATQQVTVDWTTVERPAGLRAAAADVDYTHDSGTAVIPVGQTTPTAATAVRVPISDDGVPETDETFLVQLSNAVDASLADPTAVGTINGMYCVDSTDPDAPAPALTVDDQTGAEDSGVITFAFRLDPPYCQDWIARISYLTDGTATPNVDFWMTSRAVQRSWHRLVSELNFSVALIDDDIDEQDETIVLNLSNSGRVSPGTYSFDVDVTGTIVDNEQASLSVADVSGPEGGFVNFVIRLDRPSSQSVTVAYTTGDADPASAASGADYVGRSGIAEIPAGRLSATVPVFVRQDDLNEADETFVLLLSSPTGGAELDDADAVATATILDDDDLPSVRAADASTVEGGKLEFVLTLSAPSGRTVLVPAATSDVSATAGDDYTARASADVEFAPGTVRRTVTVQTLIDDEVENNESLQLLLGPMPGGDPTATIGDEIGIGVIRDSSNRRLSVSDAAVREGGVLEFEVGFSDGPSGRDVTVQYRTRAGTATAGGDYSDDFEAAAGELRIVAGDTSAAVRVPTVADRLDEDNETLELLLSNPDGAEIVEGAASGVIIDNDPQPALRASDAEATESAGASAEFTLSLSEVSGRDVTVDYTTADGTATAGNDYTAPTGLTPGANPTVTIPAGHTTVTVDVPLVDDGTEEDVERFQLRVTGAVNAQRDDSVGVATIIDDDGPIQIIADDPPGVREGAGASAAIQVRLSRADPDNPVTVRYSTADGEAAAGTDYTAVSSQLLTFAAGVTTATANVALVDDDISEVPETFRLVLSGQSSNAEIGDGEATVLILDDDGLPTLSARDAVAAGEGSTATFTIDLSRAVAQRVTVGYAAVADSTAADETAATEGLDYADTSGTATIPVGATSATVTVQLPQDSFDENTETFWLRLSGPNGATILDGTAVGTINDDDPLPALSISDAAAEEGTPLSFDVHLDTASGRTVTVPWTTRARPAGPTAASPGDDYTTGSGTATFAPGTTAARFDVASLEDTTAENDETFQVQLGTPVDAALDVAIAVGAIHDDDSLPRISIQDVTVAEADGPAVFVVTLSHASSQPVTVGYDTVDGTATEHTTAVPGDYAPDQARTLTFPALSTRGEISVFINDDAIDEGAETFAITLTDPVNAVIAAGAGTATGTIIDDDGPPRIEIAGAEAAEHEGAIVFAVTLSHASSEAVSFRYTTFDGTATQPDDYTAAAGIVTVRPGETAAAVAISLADDNFVESTESFLVRLDNPAGAELANADAAGVIYDDDNLPDIRVAIPAIAESDGSLDWRVTLSHESDVEVTVDYWSPSWDTCHGSAPRVDGTLEFEPGSTTATISVPVTDDNVACWRIGGNDRGQFPTRWQPFYLARPVNANVPILPVSVVYGVIHDDDGKTLVSIEAQQVGGFDTSESDGQLVFDIRIDRPFALDLTVPIRVDTSSVLAALLTPRTPGGAEPTYAQDFNGIGPHATAGSDFVAVDEGVTIAAGEVAAEVVVQIIDDDIAEDTEKLTIVLPLLNGLPADDYLTQRHQWVDWILIADNDSVNVSVEDVEVLESAGNAVFRLQLDRDNSQEVRVQYTTADGTAISPDDYTETSGTAVFAPGTRNVLVSVPVIDDDDDADESFDLQLSSAAGATISDNSGTATIRQDSDLPVITIAAGSVTEPRRSGADELCFTITTTDHPGNRVTATGTLPGVQVTFDALEAPWLGSGAATLGSDFDFPTSWRGDPVGLYSAEEHICMWISNDDTPEPDEMFIGWLSNPVGAVLGNNMAWGTIFDRDPPIATVSDASASESDAAMEFTIQLHAPDIEPSSFDFTTVVRTSAGDSAARPGTDYTTASGTVDIPTGATTATVTVPIVDDTDDEADETFLLVLSNPDNLEFRDSVATGTITDDDDGYWISDRTAWESAGTMQFTLQRDHTSTGAVTVGYRIGAGGSAVGGTSCADEDTDYVTPYAGSSGSVAMAAAATEATIDVEICNDADAEGRENLLVELTNVAGRQTTAVGTIVDDDRSDLPRINIGDAVSRTETLLATVGAQFQISADGPLTDTVTVTWRTENCLATDTDCPDPAAAGDDYTAVSSGTVTLTPDRSTATATVTVLNDTTDENDEQFFVRIIGVVGPAVAGTGTTRTDPVGIGHIADDD